VLVEVELEDGLVDEVGIESGETGGEDGAGAEAEAGREKVLAEEPCPTLPCSDCNLLHFPLEILAYEGSLVPLAENWCSGRGWGWGWLGHCCLE